MDEETDTSEPTPWPFSDVTPEAYAQLPEHDRQFVERMIRDMIDGTESRH